MSNRQIAVFWDLETCYPVSSPDSGSSDSAQASSNDSDAGVVVNNIRRSIAAFGSLGSIKAYIGRPRRPGRLAEGSENKGVRLHVSVRRKLCLSGVQIVEPPSEDGLLSGSAKAMLISDVLIHAMDWSTKSPIVLITNDIEMSYPMALLRHRQFSVILAASSKSPAHEELKLQSSVFLDWDLDILRRNPSPVQRTTIPQALSPTPVSVPQESGSRTDKDEAIASSLPTATIRSSNITAASRLDDTGCSTCQSSPVRQTIRLDSASHSSDSKRSRRPVSSVNTGSSGSSGSGTGWSLSDLDGVNEYELGLHTPPGWPGSLKAPGKLDNRTSTPGTPMGRITQLPTNSSGRTSSQTTSTSVVVEDSIPINWPKTPKGTTTILGYRKFTPSPSIADTSDFVTAATSSSAQSSAGFNPIGSAQTPAKSPAASLSPYAPAYTRLGSQATPPTPPQPFRITTAADWPPPITSTAPEKAWVSITRPTASTSSAASTSTYVPPTSNQDSVDVSAFKPLVARLEELLKKGKDEPGRSIVGEMKADKRVLFEKANVNNYTEYLELAQRLGLIRLGGGKGNSSWVKLMPEWRDIIGSS